MEVKAAISNFLNYIYTDPWAYIVFVEPVNKKTEFLLPSLKVSSSEEHPVNIATHHFFEYYLANYYKENGKKFVRIGLEGKKCWLRRIMEKSYTQKNIARALDDIRRELNKNAGALM